MGLHAPRVLGVDVFLRLPHVLGKEKDLAEVEDDLPLELRSIWVSLLVFLSALQLDTFHEGDDAGLPPSED